MKSIGLFILPSLGTAGFDADQDHLSLGERDTFGLRLVALTHVKALNRNLPDPFEA